MSATDHAGRQTSFDFGKFVLAACRYKVTKQLGDGTYGSVWKAVNMQTKDQVICRT